MDYFYSQVDASAISGTQHMENVMNSHTRFLAESNHPQNVWLNVKRIKPLSVYLWTTSGVINVAVWSKAQLILNVLSIIPILTSTSDTVQVCTTEICWGKWQYRISLCCTFFFFYSICSILLIGLCVCRIPKIKNNSLVTTQTPHAKNGNDEYNSKFSFREHV